MGAKGAGSCGLVQLSHIHEPRGRNTYYAGYVLCLRNEVLLRLVCYILRTNLELTVADNSNLVEGNLNLEEEMIPEHMSVHLDPTSS